MEAVDMARKVCLVCVLAFVVGCVHQARYIEGTNFEIGVVVPGTDGALSLDIISYTAGGKIAATKDNTVIVKRDYTQVTSAFGVYDCTNRVVSEVVILPSASTNSPSVLK